MYNTQSINAKYEDLPYYRCIYYDATHVCMHDTFPYLQGNMYVITQTKRLKIHTLHLMTDM